MKVNRIFCIGRNYAAHVRELGGQPSRDDDCVVFMKPASSVVAAGESIVLPRHRGAVHYETELVVMLTGGERDIALDDALENVAGFTLGLDLTLRDVQNDLKKRGAPWELAKAFDGSAPLGDWKAYKGEDLQALEFTCHVNGQLKQQGRTADMLFPVARLVSILSKTWSLEPGDVIFTGTPAGVGPLVPGDKIQLAGRKLGRFEWTCA